MKSALILATITSTIFISSVHARTWTSAEEDKTFEGRYIKHDDTNVTVMKSGRKVSFPLSMLSETDQTWVSEQKTEPDTADEPGELGSIGKKLKGKLVQLKGRRFSRMKPTKTPEYYLLYFSASW